MKYTFITGISAIALVLATAQVANANSELISAVTNVTTSTNGVVKTTNGNTPSNTSGNASVNVSGSATVSGNSSSKDNGNSNGSSVTTTTNTGATVNASSSGDSSMNGSNSSTNNNGSAYGNVEANTSTTGDMRGSMKSSEHRSAVSAYVQSLLSVADRSQGIGGQVRVIAQSQNDSATTTANAMAKIESRGSFRTFLFGSDYKSLGVIKAEIASTSENISKLSDIANTTTDASLRGQLNAQIEIMKEENAKLEAYIEAHMSSFGIFGWLNRMIND
jgi:hypothetical protein